MSSYPHLHDQVAAYMGGSNDERIAVSRKDRWIGYAKAKSVLDELDQLIVYPFTQRPPCRLIVARGDNGKTALLRQFQLRHPAVQLGDGGMSLPVLRINMPAQPDLSQLWSEVLTRCATTHRRGDPASAKYTMVVSVLRVLKVRVLAIDEFNDVALARKGTSDVLAGIRKLSNELNLSIVAAGTEAAVHALAFDAQMRSRFSALSMPKWGLDLPYLSFLNTYERLLPLALPSGLAGEEIASVLHAAGGEAIGGTVTLLRDAAALAIRSGQEKITVEIIKAVQETASHATALAEI